MKTMTTMDTLGRALYRLSLLLLPAELREAWGDEMLATFLRRQREVREHRGPAALPLLWLREVSGTLRVAWRARRPDPWARPPSSTPATTPGHLMDQLLQDLRFAARTFVRRRGMMGLAALSLALGIGASTAMFSVVDSVLLRPLPFPEPDELVRVYPTNPDFANHPTFAEFADRGTFSPPEFWWLEENQRVFEGFGAYFYRTATLSGADGPPEQLSLVQASPGFLDVTGVRPLRGRLFDEGDDPRTGARTVMLTEDLWRTRFGGDPGVVGRTLQLDDEPWTVIGVLPDRVGAVTFASADAWRLVAGSSAEGNWGNHSVSGTLARLRDGVTPEQARAELSRLMAEVPEAGHTGHGASVFPALEDMTRNVRPALVALLAAAGLLLLVGCGNVAAILLGAGIDREAEIAVRASLGASRGRLGRQLLTESAALAGVGALGGIGFAWLVEKGLLFLAPPGLPRIDAATLDLRVLAFAVGVSAVAGLLFGMVPALGLSRPDLASAITSSRGATHGKSRLQAAVVVGELALATVLLVSAGLLGRSLFALNAVDLGLEPDGLYAVRLAPPWQRFQGEGEEGFAEVDGYLAELQGALERTPGVASVAMTSNIPLTGDRANNVVSPEGWDSEAEDEALVSERRFVSEGYFATAGIDLVEGRGFEAADNRTDAAPVMVISEGLARRVWPDEPAVGKQISYWGRDPSTVVGVARDLRDESATRASSYAFYVPARQAGALRPNFLVRVAGDPETVLPSMRQAVWGVDPDVPVTQMTAMTELFADALDQQRYRARLMIAFAVLAALFAMMGVYGVVSRSVARRTREMGIRMALGAERGAVRRMVLVQGARLAGWGAVLGLVGAALATGLLEDLLYETDPVDPVTFAGIALLVAGASLLAALPPSFRATRVDPSKALRTE